MPRARLRGSSTMRFNTPNTKKPANQRVQDATDKIAALRVTLLAPSPAALESHLPALEEALHDLQLLQHDHARGDVRQDLQDLAAELKAAGRLIEHGLAFERGWARLLAAATGSYRPDGEPRPIQT